MKSVMVIIDGMSDVPSLALGGRTPMEAAFAPHMHYIANRGTTGRMKTHFEGFPVESMSCIMGMLGYEQERYYPNGRASFEAMAKGIHLKPEDLILRCNIITADEEHNTIADFTAGNIDDTTARIFISQVELPFSHWELHPGQSYRNILIVRGGNQAIKTIRCKEPHMNIGRPISDLLPQSSDPEAATLMAELSAFLLDTRKQAARMDLPETCKGNMLWLWSPSIKPIWPSFKERSGGRRGAIVGGLDFIHGIAMAAKMHFDVVPGATGYFDTDYGAKCKYAIKHLEDFDFVVVHVNATDEEAHRYNPKGKMESIEIIDKQIVGPLLAVLLKEYCEDFRIVVTCDHMTRSTDGKHVGEPVPYALFGSGIKGSDTPCFCEAQTASLPIVSALDFLPQVMWKREN